MDHAKADVLVGWSHHQLVDADRPFGDRGATKCSVSDGENVVLERDEKVESRGPGVSRDGVVDSDASECGRIAAKTRIRR